MRTDSNQWVPDMKPRMNHKLLLLLLGLLTAIPQTVAAFRKQSDPKLMGKPAQGQHLQDRDHSIKVDVNLVPVLLTVSDHHALLEAENISSGNCYISLFSGGQRNNYPWGTINNFDRPHNVFPVVKITGMSNSDHTCEQPFTDTRITEHYDRKANDNWLLTQTGKEEKSDTGLPKILVAIPLTFEGEWGGGDWSAGEGGTPQGSKQSPEQSWTAGISASMSWTAPMDNKCIQNCCKTYVRQQRPGP